MRSYIIRRILLMIPSLLLVSLIVFFLIRMIPGDIIDLMVGQMGSGMDIDQAAIEAKLGLDKPIVVQYFRWMNNLLFHGDLGVSLWSDVPVKEMIQQRFPVTLELGLMSMIVSLLISLPIGIVSAIRPGTFVDWAGRGTAIFLITIPSFWIGTLVIVFPSIWWGISPPTMLIRFSSDPLGNIKMFILPAIILGMSMSGVTMRMMRTMMLDSLKQDYIRTAWAKGLSERTVIQRHALKNALIPIVTLIGLQARVMIGGTVIIENIFSLPGIGRLITSATSQRDYTVVSGVMLVFAVGIVFLNLFVDLSYGLLDPRVKYE